MVRFEDLSPMPVVIAVADMDAALPTKLAWLIPVSIIGVPASTGYGMARRGETALSAMLSRCAPGPLANFALRENQVIWQVLAGCS